MRMKPEGRPDYSALWKDAGTPTWESVLADIKRNERAEILDLLRLHDIEASTDAAVAAAMAANPGLHHMLRGRQMRTALERRRAAGWRFDPNGIADALSEARRRRDLTDQDNT